jgi:hypothetical protein
MVTSRDDVLGPPLGTQRAASRAAVLKKPGTLRKEFLRRRERFVLIRAHS